MPKRVRLAVNKFMVKKGWNISELMRQSGLSYVTASRLAKDKATSISFDVLGRLCELFEVTPSELLVLEDAGKGKGAK